MNIITTNEYFDLRKDLDESVEQIWHTLYPCRIPYVDNMSEDYLKQFGLPITGFKEIDNTIYKQLIHTELTINDMIEKYKLGITVRLKKHDDSIKIYEVLQAHLSIWSYIVKNGVNIGKAPIDDLIMMDEFASVIYPHAKNYFDKKEMISLLKDSSTNLTTSLDLLFKDGVLKTHNPFAKAQVVDRFDTGEEKREGFAKDFKTAKFKIRQWKITDD